MVIFLYGLDTYRSSKKLKQIIEAYRKIHKTGLSLKYIDAKKITLKELQNETKQISIFKEKKLIVLMDTFLNVDFKKDFIKQGKTFVGSDNLFVFYERDKILKRDVLFKFLIKNAKFQEFNFLEGLKLRNWLEREFKSRGAKIEKGALEKFISFIDNDSWQMINELEKLAHYKNGEIIKAADVGLLIRPKVEPNIFKTIEAIALKDKKRALKLLREHMKKGDSPFYLFSMINYQFRNLLIIKDLLIKNLSLHNLSGLHPFVVRKNRALAEKFEFSELKKIYQKMFEIDFNIKTGKSDPETALDLFITEI